MILVSPLPQVPPSCGITPQSARPDAQDEELLEDLLLLSKSKSAEDAEEDHGWWSTVLLAALRFCPAPAALASATTVRLPRGLAPLQAQEAVDLSRLARLLQRACLRGDPGRKDAPRIRLGGTFGFGWLSVPELLGVLGSPEAAKAARKEVQAVAMESARTGVFEQKTAQIHHFAMLKWAGADWSEQSDAGRTPLHALCAGAYTRTCVGGGGRAAPLRGGAWGAKARYLARDAGEWHASVDEHGLSPLNYVLPPIKPTCNCVGTVDWELIQSLMSFLWLQFDPHRIQHQAMQALSAPINAFSCIIAVMNTQLSWIDMPNDGGSLEVDPTVQSEECMEQDYISTMLDGGEGRASTPSSVDAFSCALVECRMNFAEARVRCRRYLEPMVRLQLLRAAAKQRQWQGASGKKRCEQLLVEGRERWKLRKEDLERRIWRLEMELVQTIALPPPVTSSPSKVEAPQEVQVTEAEWLPPARAAAEALVQRLRRQRLVEAARAGVFKGFRKLAECTWDEDKDFQWLTQVPALQVHYQRYGPMLRRYFLDLLQLPEKHPGFRPPDLLLALKALTEQVEKALADKSASLLDSLHDLASRIYGGLAQACRMNSVTWHAEVRRGFTAERLLLIPGTSQVGPRQRPKRLFTKEAWWDLEPELQTTKAHGLSLRPLYESVPDAEFFFLRVVGLRKVCSRADVAIRLKASMGSEKAFSNWSEGIDVNDLEELEDIQTSSFFRPPGWRAVGEEEEQAAQAPAPPPAFQPPPATSARVPAWRSAASAQDAQNRAERALEEERQRKAQGQRQAQPAPAHPTPAAAGPAARPAAGPAARSARHRFAWREPRRQAESETQTRPSLPNADPRPAAPRPADPRPADPRPEERSDPRPEPREAPAEQRRRRATWSQLRAQQEEQKQAKTEERPAAEPEPAAATSSQKPRSTCISAWSPRSPAAKLEVNGSETTTGPSSEGQADAADAADGSVRGSETTDAPPESAELVRRLAELRRRAQQRRSEVEDLRQECRTVEDTTQRYLRILKEFYDNM
ncbi:unnamed protein product [Effrenium voratum]|nr:unnamed protein product [Effrenium voratum]